MFDIGSTVTHPIHGLGVVRSIGEKEIMGQKNTYAEIFFPEAKLTISVRADGEGSIIRPLIKIGDIPSVEECLRAPAQTLPSKSSERYNLNLRKIKGNDIMGLAEIVRDLTHLSLTHKLSPKEQAMLKQTRRAIAVEMAHITEQDIDELDARLDELCRPQGE